jgi:hypothetical protein
MPSASTSMFFRVSLLIDREGMGRRPTLKQRDAVG